MSKRITRKHILKTIRLIWSILVTIALTQSLCPMMRSLSFILAGTSFLKTPDTSFKPHIKMTISMRNHKSVKTLKAVTIVLLSN